MFSEEVKAKLTQEELNYTQIVQQNLYLAQQEYEKAAAIFKEAEKGFLCKTGAVQSWQKYILNKDSGKNTSHVPS